MIMSTADMTDKNFGVGLNPKNLDSSKTTTEYSVYTKVLAYRATKI